MLSYVAKQLFVGWGLLSLPCDDSAIRANHVNGFSGYPSDHVYLWHGTPSLAVGSASKEKGEKVVNYLPIKYTFLPVTDNAILMIR